MHRLFWKDADYNWISIFPDSYLLQSLYVAILVSWLSKNSIVGVEIYKEDKHAKHFFLISSQYGYGEQSRFMFYFIIAKI